GKREARLFKKKDYVFDIHMKPGESEADKQMARFEQAEREQVEAEKKIESERLVNLDEQWDDLKAEIEKIINDIICILDGKDVKALRAARFENKATLLYARMEEYDMTTAGKIQKAADAISEKMAKMKDLQKSI
ncbi:MAG: hypothetical protein LUI12_03430, partial [Clostridiales bacterium]|nr:hypothetical protein [Clostridiales bacterium]